MVRESGCLHVPLVGDGVLLVLLSLFHRLLFSVARSSLLIDDSYGPFLNISVSLNIGQGVRRIAFDRVLQ